MENVSDEPLPEISLLLQKFNTRCSQFLIKQARIYECQSGVVEGRDIGQCFSDAK